MVNANIRAVGVQGRRDVVAAWVHGRMPDTDLASARVDQASQFKWHWRPTSKYDAI
jgi:hypothetical protein